MILEGKRKAQGLLNLAKVSCVWASAAINVYHRLQMSAPCLYSITEGGKKIVIALVYSKKLTGNHLKSNFAVSILICCCYKVYFNSMGAVGQYCSQTLVPGRGNSGGSP